MKKFIKRFFEKFFGVKIIYKKRLIYPHDMDKDFFVLFDRCKDATMTSTERMYSLYQTMFYLTENRIEGDIVECGVWKGGSSMMCAETLVKIGDTSRKF